MKLYINLKTGTMKAEGVFSAQNLDTLRLATNKFIDDIEDNELEKLQQSHQWEEFMKLVDE